MKHLRLSAVLAALVTQQLHAQGLTAQISGTVLDKVQAGVPSAKVELFNEETSARREIVSDSTGNFVFPQLLRGTYRIVITANGFRRYEQTGIVLTSTERLVLPPAILEIGDVQQSVSVTAEAARVQTQSVERSSQLTSQQLSELPNMSRSAFGLVRMLPGVVDSGNATNPNGSGATNSMNINGGRHGTMNVTFDGVSALDIGNMRGPLVQPIMDAVAEVKVMLNGAQAEYGRSSGASIHVVTKSGTRDFHGSASYYKRNEWFNANNYFSNRDGVARPLTRMDYFTFTLGGPVLLPFTDFNRARNRLFFFWSNDYLPQSRPSVLARRNFPTALERNGDFSQSFDTNRVLIPVLDPLAGRTPFPGNVIPRSRIDPDGQKLLNVFPQPNSFDPSYTFNSVFQTNIEEPRHQEIIRTDVILTANTNFYVRGMFGRESIDGPFNTILSSSSWPQMDLSFISKRRVLASNLVHSFSPTLLNEFNFGITWALSSNTPRSQATLDANDRNKLGINLPQFFPEMNPTNVLPQATFGGLTNAPSLSVEQRFPYSGEFIIYNWSNNLTKVWNNHNFKFGIYVERSVNNKAVNVAFNGGYDFSRNVNNPLDANHPYANVLIGSVNSYTEANNRPFGHGRFYNFEWFAQDSWKATRRLTIDYGVRFYKMIPVFSAGDKLAQFSLGAYDPKQAPALIQPYRATPSSPRVGRNPVTGEIVPEVKIGSFAPGSGTPYGGMEVLSERILETPSIYVSPRLGFALDLFGDGKTAIRGSAGMLPDVFRVDLVLDQLTQPPLVVTSSAVYTTIRDLLSSPLSASPNNVVGFETNYKVPTMYNWSLGVQRNIGFNTTLDVAYVATMGRNQLQRRNLNALPYGTNFLPSSIDPTLTGNRPLPANFLRPLPGYADVQYVDFANSSNYHSLQVQANRRFSSGLIFGLAYTWSRWLTYGIQDSDVDVLNPYMTARSRHYGLAPGDRRHNMVINYLYNLPQFSKGWNNAFSRFTLDNWELAGFTTMMSGAPTEIGYSFVTARDITGSAGSGIDSRVNLIANPNLPRSERTFDRFFNTAAVRPPDDANFGIGNAAKNPLIGPGIHNWDLSLTKRFKLYSERHQLMFRAEMFNVFNQTQFSDVDRSARFDAAGNQTNTRMGQYIAARDPRRMQFGLRYSF